MERAIAKRGKVKSRNLPACFQNRKNQQNNKTGETIVGFSHTMTWCHSMTKMD